LNTSWTAEDELGAEQVFLRLVLCIDFEVSIDDFATSSMLEEDALLSSFGFRPDKAVLLFRQDCLPVLEISFVRWRFFDDFSSLLHFTLEVELSSSSVWEAKGLSAPELF
jgi:hypothetical protein